MDVHVQYAPFYVFTSKAMKKGELLLQSCSNQTKQEVALTLRALQTEKVTSLKVRLSFTLLFIKFLSKGKFTMLDLK